MRLSHRIRWLRPLHAHQCALHPRVSSSSHPKQCFRDVVMGSLADRFTKPYLLTLRVYNPLRPPSKALTQTMYSSANNSNGVGAEGLKLVYNIPKPSTSEPVKEFQAVTNGVNENGVDADDDCASTSFKPRRAFCHTCRKAQSLCICVRIKTIVDNKVGITILQHPEEKDHHLGTARIAALSLRNVEVLSLPEADARTSFRIRVKMPGSKRSIAGRVGNKGRKTLNPKPQTTTTTTTTTDVVGEDENSSDEQHCMPSWMNVPAGAGLLFPSDKAIDLVPEFCEGKDGNPTHLIVLDGTWSKAKRIYFENLWLHDLQHYNLPPSEPSMYGSVRREPKVGCLSTVESIVFALKMLEPDTVGLDSLLDVFDSMIEDAKGFQAQTELRYLNHRRDAAE